MPSLETPEGAPLTWIFDHCVRYPSSYEIPLRTMYAINCNPTKTPLPGSRTPETAFTPRNSTSTKSSRSSQEDSVDAAADFRSLLVNQISRLPSQPCSLPPSFLTSFLRRCFTPELESVDFPQALTALDYLKDLENRRRKEVSAAMQRLNITREDVENPKESELGRKYPGVISWLETMSAKGRTLEATYTQIYIALRRWTLINSLLLEPHNKFNNIAMLNTLFLPSQRDGFFRYINAVDSRGSAVLDPVIFQGSGDGHNTSWPLVHAGLEKYMNLAMEVIDECVLINEPAHLEDVGSPYRPKNRKVDSGISFGSHNVGNSQDINEAEGATEKPLPQFPAPKSPNKGQNSALERLVTEIRKLGPSGRSKNLRKMKSTTALASRPGSQQSYAETSYFEIDEQKRRRLVSEATKRKKPQPPIPGLHTQ
ncbi:hypothetical protein N7512_009782 [Penicillium capsulatum]|nr:hypothetical protein N7512_009782 [Penicillium capsulatum]